MKRILPLVSCLVFTLTAISLFGQDPAGNCFHIDYEEFIIDNMVKYVSCSSEPAFNAGNEFTVEVWIRAYDSNWNQKIMGRTNPSFNSGFVLAIDQGKLYPEVFNPSVNEMHAGFLPPFQPGGSKYWVHLATTFKAGDSLVGYVNGERVDAVSVSSTPMMTNSDAFIMGIAPWDLSNFQFFGSMDEVRMWDYARSQEEIHSQMHQSLVGGETGLIAYFDFNEESGSAVPNRASTMSSCEIINMSTLSRQPSRAPLGDDMIKGMSDVEALWNGLGFSNPRFVATDAGLSMSSVIADSDYVVFGHGSLINGVTTDDLPLDAPASAERCQRIWYLNLIGDLNADFSFNLINAAGGGASLTPSLPAENYVLLYRESHIGGDFTAIANASQVIGSDIVTFDGIELMNGYYTLAAADEAYILAGVHSELDARFMEVYPNPANHILTVKYPEQFGKEVSIHLIDPLGKILLTTSHTEIDISKLQEGLYYVQINTPEGSLSKKVIVLK